MTIVAGRWMRSGGHPTKILCDDENNSDVEARSRPTFPSGVKSFSLAPALPLVTPIRTHLCDPAPPRSRRCPYRMREPRTPLCG